jgi:hypothetical protein
MSVSLNLSARLASQFTRNVRHRGEEYYWHDQVRIERASESELHARVRGSQTYELRCTGQPVPPSLIVVPKSLVFNWKEEAERFTPQLRVWITPAWPAMATTSRLVT